MIFINFILGVAVQGITTSEAKKAYNGQIKWANMLRPDYCTKGRDLVGVPFPVIYIKDVDGVTKDEILQEAKALGAKVSYPTLNRWVSKGMVSRPVTESRGRKEGRVSHYKTHALFEVFAAWDMQNGEHRLSANLIRDSRESTSFAYPFLAWYVSVFRAYLFHYLHEPVKPCFFRLDATLSDDDDISFIEMDHDPDDSLKVQIADITPNSEVGLKALAVFNEMVIDIARTKKVAEVADKHFSSLAPEVVKVIRDITKIALSYPAKGNPEDYNEGNLKLCHISPVKQDYIITLSGEIVHFHKRDTDRGWICVKKARVAEILNME